MSDNKQFIEGILAVTGASLSKAVEAVAAATNLTDDVRQTALKAIFGRADADIQTALSKAEYDVVARASTELDAAVKALPAPLRDSLSLGTKQLDKLDLPERGTNITAPVSVALAAPPAPEDDKEKAKAPPFEKKPEDEKKKPEEEEKAAKAAVDVDRWFSRDDVAPPRQRPARAGA